MTRKPMDVKHFAWHLAEVYSDAAKFKEVHNVTKDAIVRDFREKSACKG